MVDAITLQRAETIHPTLRQELNEIIQEIGKRLTGRAIMRITSAYRTFEEQDGLYAQGRTKPGKVITMARGGQSFHNYGMAVDCCLIVDGKDLSWSLKDDYDGDKTADFMEIVFVFKQHGWEWAGEWTTFKEYPHFQKSFGKSLPALKADIEKSKAKYPVL